MKRFLLLSLLFLVSILTLHPSISTSRTTVLLDFGWKFHAGDIAGAEAMTFDDSDWRVVDLPHDFQIEQPWVAPGSEEHPDASDPGANVLSRLSSRGFKEMGIGWYRKTFTPDEAWRGRRILLDFEGILYVGDAYINGHFIGKTDYGYLGFEADITKYLRWGETNVITVRADTREPNNSRWYTGAGLYRDVHLIITDPSLYFTRHPLRIIATPDSVDSSSATIAITAEVTCFDRNIKSLPIAVRILDREGRVVAEQTSLLPPSPSREYPLPPIAISDAHLWDIDDPYLYTAEVSILSSSSHLSSPLPIDRVTSRFGIRQLEFSPDFGMKLNGNKVILKGIANHHTLGALGAAAYPRAIEKRLRLLKDFGFNHIRTSHNPYSASLLDLCDSLGILVVDELYDKWLTQYCGGRAQWTALWQHDIPEWIRRDRNHPCIVFWSLGNELQTYANLPYNDWGVTPYRMMKPLLRRYDDTRLITVAMHPRGRSQETDSLPAPLVMETDIAAYNYRYMYFPGDGRRFPWMMFYQSEASMVGMGPNYYEMDLDRVIGLAYWGAIDYLGESQGWPAKGWAQGAFYIDLSPKPNAYLAKSIFSDEPVVHLCFQEKSRDIEWNGVHQRIRQLTDHWTRTPGEELNLTIYTNADEVELIVNGKSLGIKQNNHANPKVRNQIRWDKFTYEPGYIEAIARTAGKIVARHREETTGPAVALRLTPDNDAWHADGLDLQHVRVEAVDKKGRVVPTADMDVHFTIDTTPSLNERAGRRSSVSLIAVSSGDHYSDELTQTDHRRLYLGSALAILRAGQSPANVTLTATAPGLKPVKLKLHTQL